MSKLPPVLPSLPLVGHAMAFNNDRINLLWRGYRELGPLFTLHLGPQPMVVMLGPDYQQFFFNETDKTLSMDKPYRALAAAFGRVAFLASPEVYQDQRPLLVSAFKQEKMRHYLKVMQREAGVWLDGLGEAGEFEVVGAFNRLVQTIAGFALMGEDFQGRVGREFWELYTILGETLDFVIPPDWPTPSNLRRDRAKAQMRAILAPIIAERRQHPERYDDFLQDFINTKLRSGHLASDETVGDLLRGLMFAGHETTVGQTAWTVIELARHPAYAARMEAEIAAHLPAGQPFEASAFRGLQHLAWAVREIERLHPSADILMRLTAQDVEVGGYHIPKGWLVLVSPSVAHRLPEWFAEPERFDPLRFAPPREEDQKHRFALFGFGGGLHKCMGMNFANTEIMTITAMLWQNYTLTLVDENPAVNYGLGAPRPTPTRVRYQRRPSPLTLAPAALAAGAGG